MANMPHQSSQRHGGISAVGSVGAIRLWTVDLNLSRPDLQAAADTLSDDERARAARFCFDVHRRRFVLARAALRAVLAEVVGAAPADLRFRYGPRGKPALDDGARWAPQFNVSHCDDLAVIAVGADSGVGVDVEAIRPVTELEEIAREYFSAAEQAAILADANEVPRAFFRHWTVKEAWLKADGTGLSGLVSSVELTAAADGSPRLRRVGGADLPYSLHEWAPAPGFVAALAVAST
jgi:4'-phosphopantetheinyl transferase